MPTDTPADRPKRYVVPYTDDGSFPRIYEWFPGITDAQDETGQWTGTPVQYSVALSWEKAQRRMDDIMKHEAKMVREYRARWREATPEQAVNPHGSE